MKLLIGVDDSPESRHAVEVAFEFFGPHAEYTIASISETRPMYSGAFAGGTFASSADLVDRFDDAERVAHERAVHAAESIPGGTAEIDASIGHPGSALCEIAVEHDVDAIVIGSHDSSVWERLLRPSTGRYLIDHAPCPVLVVR